MSNAVYWPHGAPLFYAYGNQVVPVFIYNSRLQPYQIYATINNNANQFLWFEDYLWDNSIHGGSATTNNGNLLERCQLVGNGVPYNSMTGQMQDFTYDTANRVSTVIEHDNNMLQTLQRGFAYDPYGNMWIT